MEDLSLHILDIVENAIRAAAQHVWITITEDAARDELVVEITDDGVGMSENLKNKAADPFTTTKKTSRVGLGIPLLEQAAQESGGNLSITSEPGKGTTVRATFQQSHIDRKPLGAMSQTLLTLIAGNPTIDFTYRHTRNNQTVHFDTAAWKQELEGIPINNPEVLRLIKKILLETLSTIGVS